LRHLLVALACTALACGSSGGDDSPLDSAAGDASSDDADPSCELPAYADDIVPGTPSPSLPAEAFRAANVGGSAVVCGDGYVAVVPAGGGAPRVRSDARLAGPCGGVAAVGEDRAIAVTWAGEVLLVDISVSGAPAVLDAETVASATLYDVSVIGDRAWIAAGPQGVLDYSLAGGQLTQTGSLPGASDARSAVQIGSVLLVADGYVPGDGASDGGAEIRLLSTAGAGAIDEVVGLTGMATRAIAEAGQSRAVILRPGHGFDVVTVSDSALTVAYSARVESGVPLAAVLSGDTLLVAAGSEVQRYALGADSATLVSVEERAGRGDLTAPWFRSVIALGSDYAAVTDDAVVPLVLGDAAPAPEISLERHTFSLVGDQTEALLRFANTGGAQLIIAGIEADAPFSAEIYTELATEREGCPGQYVVEPGASGLAWERYSGDDAWHTGDIRILSNDADEPELVALAEINRPLPAAGDDVDAFALLTARGNQFRLQEHLGKVILAKLYNPT
jgi:hypothetical protein